MGEIPIGATELERMVTMGTGTMDTAAPLGVNPRNQTLGGMSIMQAASIKRQKRTLQNFQEMFLAPFIQKSLWRFMQFDPERYPVKDFKFQAASSMGIMARELEIQNMVTLLGYVADTPAAPLILKGIVSNSSFQQREEILQGLDQMQQQSQQKGPTPEQQTAQGQLQVQADANQVQRHPGVGVPGRLYLPPLPGRLLFGESPPHGHVRQGIAAPQLPAPTGGNRAGRHACPQP